MTTMDDAKLSVAIAESIKPLLAGHGGSIQGAVIADLLATWLACHQGPDKGELRAYLVKKTVKTAVDLVEQHYDAEAMAWIRDQAEANGGVA